MSHTSRTGFRRTRRTAMGVATAVLLTFTLTDSGSAAPAQDAAPFDNGTGQATALGYKVNPTNGNLSFGITAGESIAGHQNTGATGQSRAINLGVIGVTLGGTACDGGDPTLPREQQPQPVIARSGEDGAADGKSASEAGAIEKFALATPEPFAEAITTIAPLGDPAAVLISGGRTIAHSGIVAEDQREALARTELAKVVIGGGLVELRGLTWQAIHRSGAVDETLGSFELGELLIGGQPVPLPGDALGQLQALTEALAPLGLEVVAPRVRVEEGIVFVDPLKIAVVPSPTRDGIVAPILGALQPVRDALVDALLDIDCGNATYITVVDLVLGGLTGAGELGLELGGVQATTGEIEGFSFPGLPPLVDLPPVPGLDDVLGEGLTPNLGLTPAATPPAAAPADDAPADDGEDEVQTQSIADVAGERGGLMALVGGVGLLLLLATAEADRRKMQRALREIPLEA